MKPFLYFITGVPGSGKSTIIEPLRRELGAAFDVHDFDERGVPDNVTAEWHETESRHWIEVARANLNKGVVTIICGFARPSKAAVAAHAGFILLDVDEAALTQRLKNRYQNPKNVEELLRMTGKTPAEFIDESARSISWLRDLLASHAPKIVNTSLLTPQETAREVAKTIKLDASPEVKKEKTWHQLFRIGIILKGLNGIFEIVSSTLILTLSKNLFTRAFLSITRGELLEDPNDKFINYISHSLQHLSPDTKLFAGIYILVHGVLNVFLAIQLFREKLWAYLVSMGFMVIFIVYQIYRINHGHSLALAIITVFDVLFVMLTWHEYRYKVRMRG